MRRNQNTKQINTKLFNSLFVQWWKDTCSEALANDAEENFRELLIAMGGDAGITSHKTIHSWRFRKNPPAIGETNLNVLKKIFGVSVALPETEEKTLIYTKKAITLDAQLAIEFYQNLARFLHEVELDVEDWKNIELNYYKLEFALECRAPFLSDSLRNLCENAIDEVAYPLTERETFDATISSDIGRFTDDGFLVENEMLLRKVEHDILRPYKEKLERFANDIQSIL